MQEKNTVKTTEDVKSEDTIKNNEIESQNDLKHFFGGLFGRNNLGSEEDNIPTVG